ncbi:hypothetical protein RJ641_026130 [Dillenia turbinata]|uniref:Uncharacterized protein n=1 Tax=Dillenia turbinata TaxID=194707 RepID=A0AAN8WEB9_9MAGN
MQELPVWWRWFAWICPYQWSLYGLATSQYGNVDSKLDTGETVAEFVENYFGFRYDFLGPVAGVLVALSSNTWKHFPFSFRIMLSALKKLGSFCSHSPVGGGTFAMLAPTNVLTTTSIMHFYNFEGS